MLENLCFNCLVSVIIVVKLQLARKTLKRNILRVLYVRFDNF
jgi:hypothetical protein